MDVKIRKFKINYIEENIRHMSDDTINNVCGIMTNDILNRTEQIIYIKNNLSNINNNNLDHIENIIQKKLLPDDKNQRMECIAFNIANRIMELNNSDRISDLCNFIN